MPIFRTLRRFFFVFGFGHDGPSRLPLVMGKGFIGLSHTVGIFFLLDCCALIVETIGKLECQRIFHGFSRTRSRVVQYPAHGKRHLTEGAISNRHLICGAANTSRFDLDRRLGIFKRPPQRPLEDCQLLPCSQIAPGHCR